MLSFAVLSVWVVVRCVALRRMPKSQFLQFVQAAVTVTHSDVEVNESFDELLPPGAYSVNFCTLFDLHARVCSLCGACMRASGNWPLA